jgi:hypothetical protein
VLLDSNSNGGLQSDAEEPGLSSDTTDEFPTTPWEVQAHHIAIYSHTSMAAALEELMAETEHAGGYTSPNIEHQVSSYPRQKMITRSHTKYLISCGSKIGVPC